MTAKDKKKKKEKNLECPVCDISGKKVDTILLNSSVFNGAINVPLIHHVVRMYNANKRAGSASVKTKAQVRGGGKKPWRQKGTGRARTGSIRNPLWRGGGIIFGPKYRDFSFTTPKKMKRNALKSSINKKFLDGKLMVIDKIEINEPKTKLLFAILNSLGVDRGEKAMIILENIDENMKLASRNIPNISVRTANNYNALDILNHSRVIIQRETLAALMEMLQ